MKIQHIKQKVYEALGCQNTKELKKTYPKLVKDLDLRTKASWLQIENAIKGEIDILFDKAINDAKREINESNQVIQETLNNWEEFKKRISNQSTLEKQGKLSHLSDYRMSNPKQKRMKKKNPKKSNILYL